MGKISLFDEFKAAFGTLVRTDVFPIVDSRRKNALKFLATPLTGLRALIDEELLLASDLAAMLSDCVGVKRRQSMAELKKDTSKSKEEFILISNPDVPRIDVFLDFLMTSANGKTLYREIAKILFQALSEPGLRVHLYYPNGRPDFKKEKAAAKNQDNGDDREDEPKDLVDLLDNEKSSR